MDGLNDIKRRLIHFDTDGRSIVSDFVEVRQRRTAALRRAVHACFYIQCAAALVCAVCGFAAGGAFTGLAMTIGGAAVAAAALMSVAGEPMIRLVSCALDLIYALICFIAAGGGAVFAVCGVLMLAAALAAGAGLGAGYFRGWLAQYPASKIGKEDYTLTAAAGYIPAEPEAVHAAPPEEIKPAPQPSELMLIAEKVSDIMRSRTISGTEEQESEVHTGESTQG